MFLLFRILQWIFPEKKHIFPGKNGGLQVQIGDRKAGRTPLKILADAHIERNIELFNRYYLPCHKEITMYCLGLLKDIEQAENVASETLLKLVGHENPEEIREVQGWLFTVAKNKCLTILSTQKRRTNKMDDISLTMNRVSYNTVDSRMDAEHYEKLINKALDKRDNIIWELYQQGYDNKEIAEKLDIPYKTVANRKTEIRKILREAIHATL